MSDIQKYGDEKSRQLNEALIKKNPNLGLIDERVVYDKKFLLEVQAAGYNPLDKEDVQNYLEQQPPKNQERNMVVSGAYEYKYLGQGEYEEDDMKKFMKKTGAGTNMKKADDIYLSDYHGKQREILTEKMQQMDMNLDDIHIPEDEKVKYRSLSEAEDLLRKNMAKAFGSDSMDIRKEEYINSQEKGLVRKNENTESLLELIRELRALGFTPEEIKKEIQIRNR